jgi:hypothetical protein
MLQETKYILDIVLCLLAGVVICTISYQLQKIINRSVPIFKRKIKFVYVIESIALSLSCFMFYINLRIILFQHIGIIEDFLAKKLFFLFLIFIQMIIYYGICLNWSQVIHKCDAQITGKSLYNFGINFPIIKKAFYLVILISWTNLNIIGLLYIFISPVAQKK